MDYLTKQKYSFVSRAPEVTKETFGVVRFSGFEAVSKPYEFEITVVSDNPDTDPLTLLRNPAVFTIHREENEDVDFNGILLEFQETQEFNGYYFFKAVLAPKLKWLTLTHHNQVFLDSAVPEIMEAALKDAGLYPGIDFEFRLQKEYGPLEYICQYDESHFNFVSRWAEREGIYYFFEQTPNGEKVVFTDTQISHTDLLYEKDLKYHPPSGLETLHGKEVIHSFICRHNLLPQRVCLKDYNYMKPSMTMEAVADVDENGRGENYIYGLNFDTPEEGKRLARIRAEELICGKSLFNGESSVPFMVPGFTFDLKDHYKSGYNRKYLITEVTHEGHQTGYLTTGLREAVTSSEQEMFYANYFTAIYSDAQFRPARKAVKPKISGTINAKIDAASSGKYAELDSHGRYKVILPFDRSGRFGGKASAWFRMMQPYAGQNQGMHFPLHKGTEVMLTFLDGDADRPIIAGAVPNPETASPVTGKNQTKSVIKTGKSPVNQSAGADSRLTDFIDDITDNFIEIDDMNKKEHIYIRSRGDIWKEARNRYGEYHAKEYKSSLDTGNEPTINELLDDFGSSCNPEGLLDMHNNHAEQSFDDVFKNAHVHVSSLDTVNLQKGNIYDFGGYWNYNLGNCYVEEHLDQSAKLNDTYDKDLLDKGGPHWTKVDWEKARDEDADSSPSEEDIKIKGYWDDSQDGTNVWVEKTFGNAYTYSKGHSIEVTNGDSLEIQHGGEHVEMAFRGDGSIKSWSRSGGGKSHEKKWTSKGKNIYENKTELIEDENKYHVKETIKDMESGSPVYEIDKNHSIGSMSFSETTHSAKYTREMTFAAAHSFSLSLGAESNMSFNLSASSDIHISAAASVKIGIGVAFDFEAYYNPAWKLELKNKELQLRGPGTKLTKEEELDAEIQSLALKDAKLHLQSHGVEMEKADIKAAKKQLSLEDSWLFHV